MYHYIKKTINLKKAFTLVEMIISMLIISALSLYIYSSYPFTERFLSYITAVNDFFYNLKEIQTYGASRGGEDVKGDGLVLDLNNKYNYFLFNDKVYTFSTSTGIGISNGFWDGESLEPVQIKKFSNNIFLSKICVPNDNNNFICENTLSKISITFMRPNLNAKIYDISLSNNPLYFDKICLEFSHIGLKTENKKRSIIIYENGSLNLIKGDCLSSN